MTNKQMRAEIAKTAKGLRRSRSASVEINWSLPYLSIRLEKSREDADYFFQGEEAANLLSEAVSAGNRFECPVEDVLLWMADSWS